MAKKKNTRRSQKRRHRIRRNLIQAQRKNEFYTRLHQFVKAAGALEAFYLMPQKSRDLLWWLQFKPLRVEAGSGHSYAKNFIEDIRKYILKSVKLSSLNILPDGPSISLYDFCTIGQTLRYYLNCSEQEPFENYAEVQKGFADFLKFMNDDVKPQAQLVYIARYVAWRLSRINERLYWFTLETVFRKNISPIMYDCLYLQSQFAEKIQVQFEGKNLPAYRVGWSGDRGVTWVQIKPSDLFYDSALPDQPLDVFIQSDALQQLRERIDCITTDTLHFYLFDSLENFKSVLMGDGTVLIEYYLLASKAGYLVAEVADGNVIIRTFLFLTHKGTPEGQKLHEIDLKIPGKKYPEMDRMSQFFHTFMQFDDRSKELVITAGYACLFELAENMSTNIVTPFSHPDFITELI